MRGNKYGVFSSDRLNEQARVTLKYLVLWGAAFYFPIFSVLGKNWIQTGGFLSCCAQLGRAHGFASFCVL